MSQPPLCTSTKRTPFSTSRRASRQPWPNLLRPYWSRVAADSALRSNAFRSVLFMSAIVVS